MQPKNGIWPVLGYFDVSGKAKKSNHSLCSLYPLTFSHSNTFYPEQGFGFIQSDPTQITQSSLKSIFDYIIVVGSQLLIYLFFPYFR